VGAGAEEGMHLELKTCFKLLERAQWARESDAWGLQGAGGGVGQVAVTASGGEERLGHIAGQRGKAGRGQRGSGKRWGGSARHSVGKSGGGASGKETEEAGAGGGR
jgi:hypothetical protein